MGEFLTVTDCPNGCADLALVLVYKRMGEHLRKSKNVHLHPCTVKPFAHTFSHKCNVFLNRFCGLSLDVQAKVAILTTTVLVSTGLVSHDAFLNIWIIYRPGRLRQGQGAFADESVP